MKKKAKSKKGNLVKKVEIRKELAPNRRHGMNEWQYAYAKPNAETWSTGYARPFTARRGAQRHFKDFIAKGGRLVFINNY